MTKGGHDQDNPRTEPITLGRVANRKIHTVLMIGEICPLLNVSNSTIEESFFVLERGLEKRRSHLVRCLKRQPQHRYPAAVNSSVAPATRMRRALIRPCKKMSLDVQVLISIEVGTSRGCSHELTGKRARSLQIAIRSERFVFSVSRLTGRRDSNGMDLGVPEV
jgi:hypothetical protein